MRSIEEEVLICLPSFTRLCVASVVSTGSRLDQSAISVAKELHSRFPKSMSQELVAHFEETLAVLVRLVAALSPKLPPQLLKDFTERTSQKQVCETLQQSIRNFLGNSSVKLSQTA